MCPPSWQRDVLFAGPLCVGEAVHPGVVNMEGRPGSMEPVPDMVRSRQIKPRVGAAVVVADARLRDTAR